MPLLVPLKELGSYFEPVGEASARAGKVALPTLGHGECGEEC